MSGLKEIKKRIDGINETQKITNAMYLIASSKLRRAKAELDKTEPYFNMIRREIKRIFRTVGDIDSPYLYPSFDEPPISGTYGYLIITADKGLAGAYNQNIIKEAEHMLEEHADARLYIVGEYGRHHYETHKIKIEENFIYTAQSPTLHRAREISEILLDDFNEGKIKKLFVVYTDYKHKGEPEVISTRVLPFHHMHFENAHDENPSLTEFKFEPSVEKVLESMVGSYLTGFVYSALVDSFCCEQNARMTAMDSANMNAEKILDDLKVQFHHIRQNVITQEITEIASGANYQKKKKASENAGGKSYL